MARSNDNKNSRNIGSARKRVAGGQEHEVKYLAQKFNCSVEEVERAIQQVGNSREKLEVILGKNRR